MTQDHRKSRRVVVARRSLALGTLAAAVAGGSAGHAAVTAPEMAKSPDWVQLAAGEGEAAQGEGEGEGEGGGAALDSEAGLIRDLGFMQGHLRAGLALYQSGDLKAAKTHMGHPIEEKYDAVADELKDRGLARLKDELAALAQAAEDEKPIGDIAPLYERVAQTIDAARADVPVAKRLVGLIALTRVAGDEYTVATEGGKLSNLHEYQDSWGFLRVVDARLAKMAGVANGATAEVIGKMRSALAATDVVYGDIQGQGDFEMDPGVIYGAAARMDLALAGMK